MQTETQAGPGTSAPAAANMGMDAPRSTQRSTLDATAPGQLRTIKRNGTVVSYDESKIAVAITKAFLAVEGGNAAASSRIRELVADLADQVTSTFKRRMPSGGTVHIEEIQDQVELALMRSGEQRVARSYVLYRESRAQAREAERQADTVEVPRDIAINVTLDDGSTQPLDVDRLRVVVQEASQGLEGVDGQRILDEALKNMFDGISQADVGTSLVISARTLVEEEPNYTFATARLLADELRREALTFLDVRRPEAGEGDYTATQGQMESLQT